MKEWREKEWREKEWRGKEWRVHCDLIGRGGNRPPDLPLSRWTPCPPDHPHGRSLASSVYWSKSRGGGGRKDGRRRGGGRSEGCTVT